MRKVVLINRTTPPWPGDIDSLVQQAAEATIQSEKLPMDRVEVGIQLTSDEEIQKYNKTYRGVDRATNVLAFAMADGEEEPLAYDGPIPLGDLLLAHETIFREAQEQNKPFLAHVTHMVVHGTLHLLGYDHERSTTEAQLQEAREVTILAKLNLPNPYG